MGETTAAFALTAAGGGEGRAGSAGAAAPESSGCTSAGSSSAAAACSRSAAAACFRRRNSPICARNAKRSARQPSVWGGRGAAYLSVVRMRVRRRSAVGTGGVGGRARRAGVLGVLRLLHRLHQSLRVLLLARALLLLLFRLLLRLSHWIDYCRRQRWPMDPGSLLKYE